MTSKKVMKVICPYCQNDAKFVTGRKIYPHRPDLFNKRFYLCEPCGAYVGTHRGTKAPLGRLADQELRQWKMKAHAAFDPLWQVSSSLRSRRRSSCYKRLAKAMNINAQECHIGLFDVDQCKQVVELIKSGELI